MAEVVFDQKRVLKHSTFEHTLTWSMTILSALLSYLLLLHFPQSDALKSQTQCSSEILEARSCMMESSDSTVQSAPANLCYYITGHGLGHATRSLEIIRKLIQTTDVNVHVVSTLGNDFIHKQLQQDLSLTNLDIRLKCFDRKLDSGAIQSDALTVDAFATLLRYYSDIHANRKELLEFESQWLKDNNITIIIVDATPLGCIAGLLAGIKVVLLSNFTWDFCYRGMLDTLRTRGACTDLEVAQFADMIDQCSHDSSACDLYIQLPGETSIPPYCNPCKVVTGPLLSRLSQCNLREQNFHGLDASDRVVLLGFGGHSTTWRLRDEYLPNGWKCLVLGASQEDMPSERFHAMPFESYVPDLINAADVVLGKVGYGFVSECLVHGRPLIFISRSNWPEEACLVDLLSGRHQAGFEMPVEDFNSGSWSAHLERALALKDSWTLDPQLCSTTAASVIVEEIMRLHQRDRLPTHPFPHDNLPLPPSPPSPPLTLP